MILVLVTSLAIFGISLGVVYLLMGRSLRATSEARSRTRAFRSQAPGHEFMARARAPEVSSLGACLLALEVTAYPPASKPFGFGKRRRAAGREMVLIEPLNAGAPHHSLSGLTISTE